MADSMKCVPCKSAFLYTQVSAPYPYEETYSFGIDTSRFQNLVAVTNNTLLFATGNVVKAFQVDQQITLTLENDAAGGATCLTESQDGKYLAIAFSSASGAYVKVYAVLQEQQHQSVEKSIQLPDCSFSLLYRIIIPYASQDSYLISTTITAVSFNHASQFIACVTSSPDFNLYVFNVQTSQLALKAKAFTAPVMKLQFNKYTYNSLTTGGKNHVKFWYMAETFTGSKLKGDLGKFGVLQYSDVTGFAELPCGSYLTGCGQGEIAMWESVNVRLAFRRNAQHNCHDGAVEVLQIDAGGVWSANNNYLYKRLELAGAPNYADGWWEAENDEIKAMQNKPIPAIISAGSDGYIRIWSGHYMMQSQYVETETTSLYYDIEPIEEIFLGQNVNIRDIVYSPDKRTAFVYDAGSGGFIAIYIAQRAIRRLQFGHAGAVRALSISNSLTSLQPINENSNRERVRNSLTASVGASGVVFLHDLVAGRLVQVKCAAYTQATSCIFIHDNLCLVVGYADGSVRFFSLLPDEYVDNDEFCYLIAVYKCFDTAVIDLASSAAGVVLALNSQGVVFLFATSLRLVRKEEKSSASDVTTLQLNSIYQSLVNVVLDTQHFDEESRTAAELARRNARGRLGMCEKDVRPVCYLNCLQLAFQGQARQFRFPFWLDANHFAFAVSGDVHEASRVVIFMMPEIVAIERFRNSHPEQVLQSTLLGEPEHSLVSFDVSELIRPEDVKFVNVHVPPAPLPRGCEGTVAKLEQQVMQARVQAMLPSKSALENAMAALHEMGDEAYTEEDEETENGDAAGKSKEDDEIAALVARAQGGDAKAEKKESKKKRKLGVHDPLDEDIKQSVYFDFQQFNITSAEGFTTTTASEGAQIQVLLNVAVDHDVRSRADNSMDALRARAEAAQQGISIAQGQDDPAIAMAALAVAELRAAYRSSLLYCFSIQALQQFASSPEKMLTVEPVLTAPVAMPYRLISANILRQDQLDDEQLKIPDARKPEILVKHPVRSFAFSIKQLNDLCQDVTSKSVIYYFYDYHKLPNGALCTILDDGDLILEFFDYLNEFAQLHLSSGLAPKRMVFSLAYIQQPLCQLEIGFSGHLICTGDQLGNIYVLQSGVFQRFTQLAQEKEHKFIAAHCCYAYHQDSTWSTGNSTIQLSKVVDFKEEVYALLPKTSKIDKNAQNQAVIEIADYIVVDTIEQQRLIALDNADNLRGVQSQAGVQAKIDGLKGRYALLLKENENQPPNRRLSMIEIEPDLYIHQNYLQREEERAFELLQNELGVLMNATIERIFALQYAFPVVQEVIHVHYFSTTSTSVCSFKMTEMPADFTANLCKALNISSLDQLREVEDNESPTATYKTQRTEYNQPLQASTAESNASEQPQVAAPHRRKTLRPVDKIVRYLLAEKANQVYVDDSAADEFNMKRERIYKRAYAREARREQFYRLLDSKPNPTSIHPDDYEVITFASRTFGEFPLKIYDDYITIMQKLTEEQEKLQKSNYDDVIDFNLNENREGKWVEFLFTLKGLQDAKSEFNTRVRVLLAHKQAIIEIVNALRYETLRVSAQIKLLVGAQLAADLDAVQGDLIAPDFITAFAKLCADEEEFLLHDRMRRIFAAFFQHKQIRESIAACENDSARMHYFFMYMEVEFNEIFDNGQQFNYLALDFINSSLTNKLITPEEATRLKESLEAASEPRNQLVERAITMLEQTNEETKVAKDDFATNYDGETSYPTSQQSARGIAGYGAIRSVLSQIYQQALEFDGYGLTVQQLQSFDCCKLVNLYAKSVASDFTQQYIGARVRMLLITRRLIFERITALVKTFDSCVFELAQQQLYLYADFCRIRIRLVNLFYECEIHHLYVTKDANSLRNLENCKNDHYSLSLEMNEMQKYIMGKIYYARSVQQQLVALQAYFDEIVYKDAPYRTKLMKLYCKKFKYMRAKQIKEGADNPMSEYEDDEYSSSLSDGDSDNGDDEIIDETVPPEGCGQEIFYFVLNLRDKKRTCDTELLTIYYAAEQLKSQHAQLQKREKAILTNIEAANRELTSFRSNKQKELNYILTSSLVSISQICSITEYGTMQQNFDAALLFDERQLDRLFQRISRRKAELQGLQKIAQYLKQNYAQSLAKEREEYAELEILNQKLVSVQNLKFGRTVDIAKLDGIAINEQAAELYKQVDLEEKHHYRELTQFDSKYDHQKDELRQMYEENTSLVNQLSQLEQDALKLDRAILQGQKQPPKAWCSDNKQELIRQEYNNLKQAIVDRERELRGLVDEISLLKNHGSY